MTNGEDHILASAVIAYGAVTVALLTVLLTPGGWFAGLAVAAMGLSWAWMEAGCQPDSPRRRSSRTSSTC